MWRWGRDLTRNWDNTPNFPGQMLHYWKAVTSFRYSQIRCYTENVPIGMGIAPET